MADQKPPARPQNLFEEQTLDEDIEHLAQPQDPALLMEMPEARVSVDLRHLYHAEAEANAQSLSSVYARLQNYERSKRIAKPAAGSILPFPLPSATQKGSQTMQTKDSTKTSRDTSPLPRKPSALAPSPLTTIAACLVTALLVTSTLLGFHVFHTQQAGPVSTPPLVTQKGSLRCTVSTSHNVPEFEIQPLLSWSARGNIATSFPLETFGADTCTPQLLGGVPTGSLVMPVWSPDGKRLLLVSGNKAQIFDATTGRLLVNWQTSDPSEQFGSAVWAANGTQIVAAVFVPSTSGYTATMRIQTWDAATGASIHTAFSTRTFDVPLLKAWIASNGAWIVGTTWISPNGTYFAEQTLDFQVKFWNIATGQLVSTTSGIPYGYGVGDPQLQAWSPDGAYLAVGIDNPDPRGPAHVQIWSTMTGKLVTTIADTQADLGVIGGVAWSPNGDYLAQSNREINIWNTKTWQLAATFGKITASRPASGDGNSTVLHSEIGAITWSPDGRMLASVSHSLLGGNQIVTVVTGVRDTLDVWQVA